MAGIFYEKENGIRESVKAAAFKLLTTHFPTFIKKDRPTTWASLKHYHEKDDEFIITSGKKYSILMYCFKLAEFNTYLISPGKDIAIVEKTADGQLKKTDKIVYPQYIISIEDILLKTDLIFYLRSKYPDFIIEVVESDYNSKLQIQKKSNYVIQK